ncbi:hypothetical protein BGY98DRAFT_938558 [Russula aff. rugulosa BPL654]|nr:hypothetical protein BGY98DRAFT_938558 [Russula aff. rugulosa BPL654]
MSKSAREWSFEIARFQKPPVLKLKLLYGPVRPQALRPERLSRGNHLNHTVLEPGEVLVRRTTVTVPTHSESEPSGPRFILQVLGDGWSDVRVTADGSDDVSNLTFPLEPGWTFVETEDWRADIEAKWSELGADDLRWVYTNDVWLDPHAALSLGAHVMSRPLKSTEFGSSQAIIAKPRASPRWTYRDKELIKRSRVVLNSARIYGTFGTGRAVWLGYPTFL